MRNRAEFKRAETKRLALKEARRLSAPDRPGARVAILMPFVAGLVRDERDGYESFEQDAEALINHAVANDREPVVRMRATPADFEATLTDPTISTVIIRGFGNLSAVHVSKDRGDDASYTTLEWNHLARMADHLKRGKFVMRSCGGTTRIFNPPLGYGVVSSHTDILAPVGQVISLVGLADPANQLIQPVTETHDLTREDIVREFPLQRLRHVPDVVPDSVYVCARAIRLYFSDPYAGAGRPEPFD